MGAPLQTPNDLNLHDILLKDAVLIGPGGTVTPIKKLTFYVGPHGPFMQTWPAAQYTAELAKAYMTSTISGLRALTS